MRYGKTCSQPRPEDGGSSVALKAFEVFGEVSLKGEEQVRRGIKGLTGWAGGMGSAFVVGSAAVAAAGAVAVGAAAKFAGLAEEEAVANARIRNIADSMGLFGGASEEVTDRLVKLARQQALATGIDDSTIKLTQAKLLTFKELAATADEAGGAFDRATAAALDMEAAGFGTAEQNAVQLGKALQDPIKGLTALARSGVTFTDVEKERIKTMVEGGEIGKAQAEVLKAIEMQVGGTAEATATMSDRMNVAWSEIQEGLGALVLPLFESIAGLVVDKVLPAFDKLTSGEFKLSDIIPPEINAQLLDLKTAIGELTDAVMPTIRTWYDEIIKPTMDKISAAFAPVFAEVIQTVTAIVDFVKENWPAIQKAIEPVMKAVSSIIGGVMSIIAGIIRTVMAAIRGDWSAAWGGIKTVFTGIVDIIKGSSIGGIIEKGFAVVKKIGGWFSDMFTNIKGVVNKLLRFLKEKLEIAKNTLDKLNPFHRESPSLVDNVLAGVKTIESAYTGLSGLSLAGPSVGGVSAGSSGGGVSGGVVIIADPRYTDMNKVRLDSMALQRGDISTGAIFGRMGMAT